MRFLTGGKHRGRAEVEADYRSRFAHGEYWAAYDKAGGSEHFEDPLPGTELGEVEYEISRT